jgi:hypothetical protein
MKIKIEVKDEKEGQAIKRALGDDKTRALVVLVGTLLTLDSDRARLRVLKFVADSLDEMTPPGAKLDGRE